jgi:hypothetical protein
LKFIAGVYRRLDAALAPALAGVDAVNAPAYG